MSEALDAAHPVHSARSVAAFDFDGTLTHRDTLLPFLAHVCSRAAVARAVAAAAPTLLRTAAGLDSRQRAKEALLTRTLRGWWLDELKPLAEEYAQQVVDGQLRPDRVARLRWHQHRGHHVVLVSASPELYVAAVARRLGCTATLASQLEVDRRGRLTGRLFGDNVRGEEKERRLRDWLARSGPAPACLYAYGDSDGDAELLAMADVATRLHGRDRLTPEPAQPAQP